MATTEIYTLSLHDALPISFVVTSDTIAVLDLGTRRQELARLVDFTRAVLTPRPPLRDAERGRDRKSTRLNSSHQIISYAVFCLKKKKSNIASTTSPDSSRS